MSIFSGSRYEGLDFTTIVDENGNAKQFLHLRSHLSVENVRNFIVRRVQSGEELDTISDIVYNDSRKYWIISDVNEIQFPFDISDEDELIIPGLEVLGAT